jgi:hypothetical protein
VEDRHGERVGEGEGVVSSMSIVGGSTVRGRVDDGQTNSVSFDTICLAVNYLHVAPSPSVPFESSQKSKPNHYNHNPVLSSVEQ